MTLPPNSHICFICPYIEAYLKPGSGTHVGGAQRQQHLLATRLKENGHTVSFISFDTDGDMYERVDGFDVWKTLPRTNHPVRTPETFVKLVQSVRRINADVFYVRGNPPLCILSSYGCSLLGEPLVYVVANDSNIELAKLSSHHGAFKHTIPKLAYLDAVRRSEHVVSQTEYQQNLLRNVFNIQSTVVPNGYTLPPGDHVVPQNERTDVLWVGSLDPHQKRPDRFLRLAESLPDVNFRMIGWSDDVEYREKIIRQASDISNLIFEGFIPPNQIDQYYRHAVMLVNTSEYEGFPNTFLEAWRFEVPVVSLRFTLDGIITEQDVGSHADTLDEMANIVARLWEDRDKAAEMGRVGRQYLADNYALDVVFERYAQVFADIIT